MAQQITVLLPAVCVIFFGIIIGKLLTLLVYKLPRRNTDFPLPNNKQGNDSWPDTFPLFKRVFPRMVELNGKTRIRATYPLIEIITVVFFLITWRRSDFDMTQFRNWFVVSIGIAVSCIDLEFGIIPDELSIGGWLVGAVTAYWDKRFGAGYLIGSSIIGFVSFLTLMTIWKKIKGRPGIGGGDIKFMGTLGVFLGLDGFVFTICIGSIAASILFQGWNTYVKHHNYPMSLDTSTNQPNAASKLKSALKEIPISPVWTIVAFFVLAWGVPKWFLS